MKLFYVEHPNSKEPSKLVVFAYIAHDIDQLTELMSKKFSAWRTVKDIGGYELNKDWSTFHGA